MTTALRRLVGGGRGGMGALFKVLGISQPRLETLAGFVEDKPDQTTAEVP